MILVTVGMHTEGFLRLVQPMDEIAGEIEEEVVMQIGPTAYTPQHATRHFAFADQAEMDHLCTTARVIVTHAGAGSILSGLTRNKPVIVMPRLEKYGEVIDDHQLQLTEALSQAGRVIAVYEAGEIRAALKQVERDNFRPPLLEPGGLVSALRSYVAKVEASLKRKQAR